VLPAAAWAERRGTFTNLEGRITWLSQLVTDHGVAWPDWMIASELAARLGLDLGFAQLEEIWAEVTRVSPLHRGATYELISGQRARDGVVVPVGAGTQPLRSPRPLDPMADPGIASAELHKVAPSALLLSSVAMVPELDGPGVATAQAADGDADVTGAAVPAGEEEKAGAGGGESDQPDVGAESFESSDEGGSPPVPSPVGLPSVPPPTDGGTRDESAIRLVSRRTMWDGGTQVQSTPALAALHPAPAVAVHPSVLAGLGAADGETVRVTSAKGSLLVKSVGDAGLPAGTALLPWNLPGARAAELVDSSRGVTEVRIEVVELAETDEAIETPSVDEGDARA
jgi:anaerobic selenocysteine-containing dehydrogenase